MPDVPPDDPPRSGTDPALPLATAGTSGPVPVHTGAVTQPRRYDNTLWFLCMWGALLAALLATTVAVERSLAPESKAVYAQSATFIVGVVVALMSLIGDPFDEKYPHRGARHWWHRINVRGKIALLASICGAHFAIIGVMAGLEEKRRDAADKKASSELLISTNENLQECLVGVDDCRAQLGKMEGKMVVLPDQESLDLASADIRANNRTLSEKTDAAVRKRMSRLGNDLEAKIVEVDSDVLSVGASMVAEQRAGFSRQATTFGRGFDSFKLALEGSHKAQLDTAVGGVLKKLGSGPQNLDQSIGAVESQLAALTGAIAALQARCAPATPVPPPGPPIGVTPSDGGASPN